MVELWFICIESPYEPFLAGQVHVEKWAVGLFIKHEARQATRIVKTELALKVLDLAKLEKTLAEQYSTLSSRLDVIDFKLD